ncbi:MAG TPA: hypothetical protein VF790_05005 [Dissulfurispiraceae bacterium]
MLRRRYQLLLLSAVILTVFYPTIFAEVSRIDDVQMIENLQQQSSLNLKYVFFPRSQGALYYRPLLTLSFHCDRIIHGLDPVFMHLENVLIHLGSSIVVYSLALRMPAAVSSVYFPLLAALAFGLHPITTESVNWISGRTDVLAGFFILMSAFFAVRFGEGQKKRFLGSSLLFFLLGTLSKEVAIAFLPGIFLIVSAMRKTVRDDASPASREDRCSRRTLLLIAVGGGIAAGVFFSLRSMAFLSSYSKIGMTLRFMGDDPFHTVFVFLRAFGFYMKKIFIPYPLNFAILEVDPLYELFAIPVAFVCIYISLRKTMPSALFTAGVLLIFPSFPLAYGQIAWTPYAERYLYVPSAFIMLAVLAYLAGKINCTNRVNGKITALALLLILSIITLQRNLVWKSNIALCEDTVGKSPQAKDMRLVYGGLLLEKREYGSALVQFKEASNIPGLRYDERPGLYIAETLFRKGNVDGAIRITEEVLGKTKGASKMGLEFMVSYLEAKAAREREEKAGNGRTIERLAQYYRKLLEKERDPHVLHKLGVVSLALNRKGQALACFRQAYKLMPVGDPYRIYTAKRIKELSDRTQPNI